MKGMFIQVFDQQQKTKNSGFTLIELIVVLGVVSTLTAFASVNLLRLQRHTTIQSSVAMLTSDIYEQRQRAMNGNTQGRATVDSYGIYFQTSQYTLFHGSSYTPGAIDNVVIPIASPISLSTITFPSTTLLFTKGSGEISGYSSTTNSVTLSNSTNSESVTIVLNQYGTITSALP